jgi:serine/threonine protein kinase
LVAGQLADFGLSRILEGDQQTHVVTQTYGTACFMPPELLKSGHLSAAADVYSFSMVMYNLFTCEVITLCLLTGEETYHVIGFNITRTPMLLLVF